MAGDIEVQIGADLADLKAKMAEAKSEVANTTTAMGEAVRGFAAALAGAFSVGIFANAIKGSIEFADNLKDLSVKTGTSVETLAGLKLAADNSGSSLEGVATGLKFLNKNMAESPAMFKQLGISAKDPTEAMIQLGDVFTQIESPADRTALAMKLFGRSGVEMLPMLMEGSGGMRQMVEQGKRLAGVTPEMTKQADAFNDKLGVMHAQMQGNVTRITAQMLPALNGIAEAFAFDGKNGDIFKVVADGLVFTLRFLASVALIVRDTFIGLGDAIGGAAAAAVLAASGEFSKAGQVLDDMNSKSKARGAALKETLDRLWTDIQQEPEEPATRKRKKVKLSGIIGGNDSPKEQSAMGEYEAALTAKKIETIEREHRELSKAEEQAYWQAILATLKAGSKDYDAVMRKANGDRLADLRETLKSEQALEAERIKLKQALEQQRLANDNAIAQDGIAARMAQIKQQRAMGEIDAQQEIQLTRQVEQDKYNIELSYAEKKRALLDKDSVDYQKATDEIAKIERQKNASMVQLDNQAAQERRAAWMSTIQPITSAIEASVNGVMQGTQTISQAFKNLAQNIALSITQMIIKTNIELAASKLFQLGGSGGGSGGIGGSLLSSAMGSLGISLPSSAGGEWNVPQDRLNLVHKNETILPASMAEKFRDMVANGGGMGRGNVMQTTNNFTLNGPVDRATQDQIAMMASMAMTTASRRNG